MSSRLTKKRNVTKSQVKVSNVKHRLTKKHINRKSQTRKTNLYKVRKGDKDKKTVQKGGLVCEKPKRGLLKKLFGKKNDTEKRMKECFKTELLKMIKKRDSSNTGIIYLHPYDDLICRLYFDVKIENRTYAAPIFESVDYEYITELLDIQNTKKKIKIRSRVHESKRYTFYDWLADYYNFIFKDATYEDNKLILEKFMKIKFNEDQTTYMEVNSKDTKNEFTKQNQKDLSEYIKKISSDYKNPTFKQIIRGTKPRTAVNGKGKGMLQSQPPQEVSPPPQSTVITIKEPEEELKPLQTHLLTDDSKDIQHIWFTNWPDHGVPKDETKVINGKEVLIKGMKLFHSFITYVYDDMKKNGGNTVIHCSAGIGRTGVVYMVLKIKDKIEKGLITKINEDLIQKEIENARTYREGLVQTPDQYQFICNYFGIENIFENFMSFSGTIPDKPVQPGKCGDDSILRVTGTEAEHNPKNRYGNIIPCEAHRVYKRMTEEKYINASNMKSLKINDNEIEIIAAQCPLPDTITDFYEMLARKKIKRIIMVTGLVESGKTKCADYFGSTLDIGGKIQNITPTKYIVDKLILKDTQKYPHIWGEIRVISNLAPKKQPALPINGEVEEDEDL